MAIVKMKKITLAAPLRERDNILKLLQSKGCVHLVDLKELPIDCKEEDCYKEAKTVTQTEMDYNHIKSTYEFLNSYIDKKKGIFSKREEIQREDFEALEGKVNWEAIYAQCKNIKDKLTENSNVISKLSTLIEGYKEWESLDVSSGQLDKLKRTAYLIGTINKKYETQMYEALEGISKDVYIEKVSEKQQDLNLFILYHLDDSIMLSDILKQYGFSRVSIDLKEVPLAQIEKLKEEKTNYLNENAELKKEGEKLALNLGDIEKLYDYIATKLEKDTAVSKLIKTSKTFVLQGWVPEKDALRIEKLILNDFGSAFVEFEDPSGEESPPVALKNNAFVEPFEAVTSMYSLPKPNEVDPTPIMTPFFLLFFGMMMSDVGYGLAMLIGTFVMLKFMDIEGDSRKIAKLILYSSIPTIIFGFLYGSFFGMDFPALWIKPLENTNTILIVSIAVGIVHLFVGLGIKAYELIKNASLLDAIFDVGSIYAILIGGLWFGISSMGYIGGKNIGGVIGILGAVMLVLTSGRASKGIGGKLGGGLYALYGMTSYIGDALSYSRLMALGLATGLIGGAFNTMIGLLGEGITIPKLIIGPIIFLFGHTFNLLINALGAFVHTCRLQYVEFFGKFFEGGGEAFEPLKIKTKFIKVTSEN